MLRSTVPLYSHRWLLLLEHALRCAILNTVKMFWLFSLNTNWFSVTEVLLWKKDIISNFFIHRLKSLNIWILNFYYIKFYCSLALYFCQVRGRPIFFQILDQTLKYFLMLSVLLEVDLKYLQVVFIFKFSRDVFSHGKSIIMHVFIDFRLFAWVKDEKALFFQ